MAIFQRGDMWWYKFRFANRIIRESAKTSSKTLARDAERKRRRELEEGYNGLTDRREERIQSISAVCDAYLKDYKLRHRSGTFAEYALGHIKEHLGDKLAVDISETVIRRYQSERLSEKAAPKSINEEVGFLLRILGERGDAIRLKLRRQKTLKLKGASRQGKAYDPAQKAALLQAAKTGGTPENPGTRSPFIRPALALAFNAGMRDSEIRQLTWGQIDLEKEMLTVGRSKTDAGTGRTIPLNAELKTALEAHLTWYENRFGSAESEWFLFPGRLGGHPSEGNLRPLDPTRPIGSLKSAWRGVKERAGVRGRFHDTRHTLITELAENGAGDQTIMDIAGHVSRQMLSRYSHIRMEAKRKALEGIKTRHAATGSDAA